MLWHNVIYGFIVACISLNTFLQPPMYLMEMVETSRLKLMISEVDFYATITVAISLIQHITLRLKKPIVCLTCVQSLQTWEYQAINYLCIRPCFCSMHVFFNRTTSPWTQHLEFQLECNFWWHMKLHCCSMQLSLLMQTKKTYIISELFICIQNK